MRALVLHGPGYFGVESDWPAPQIRPGWALVKVAHAGICGSDLPRFVSTGSYHHPMVLGHEFAGTVEIPAPGSHRYRGGERVAVLPLIPCRECSGCHQNEPFHCSQYQFLGSRDDGGFADLCLVPEENLFPLPDEVNLSQGAFLEPLAVALHVARRSGFAAGHTALVLGAGPIGLLVGCWLKVFGASRIVMADVRAESLSLARAAGFDEVVNPSEPDWASSLPAFDATIEAAGSNSALLSAIERTRDKGTVTVLGRDTKDTVIPLAAFERLMRKEITLCGCWGYNMNGEHEFVREMLRQQRFPLDSLITHEPSLAESPEMIQAMASGDVQYCKVMIDIWK